MLPYKCYIYLVTLFKKYCLGWSEGSKKEIYKKGRKKKNKQRLKRGEKTLKCSFIRFKESKFKLTNTVNKIKTV